MLKLVTALLSISCIFLLTSCINQEVINCSTIETLPSEVVDTLNDIGSSDSIETLPSNDFDTSNDIDQSTPIENIVSEDYTIKEYIRYAKSVSDSYKLYDIRMDFFDADCDGSVDMVLYLSTNDTGSSSYLFKTDLNSGNTINQTDFFQSADSGFSYGKFKSKNSDGFFLMTCDKGEHIKYISDISERSGEDLFFRVTFDDRVTKTLTPIYIVHPFAAECSGYSPSYIEIDGIDIDYLVTEEEYNKAKEEFSKSVFAVDTNIKSVSLSYAQLESSSVDEIFNALEKK